MSSEIVILGAGGHAKVVHECILAEGRAKPIAFTDTSGQLGLTMFGLPIVAEGFLHTEEGRRALFIIGFGGNLMARKAAFEFLTGSGRSAHTVIHPSAILSSSVSIGEGTVVFPRVIVNPDTKIGLNVILNSGCIVEHDCVVGDHTHIAPGAILTGGVAIGECTLVGAGSVVLPGCRVGSNSIVGSGAVVTRDIGDGVVAVGNPARVIRSM